MNSGRLLLGPARCLCRRFPLVAGFVVLAAVRATAALHRRGLAFRTMGDDALCGGKIDPFIPKSQYRMTMFYPVADTKRSHAIGESTFRWGMAHTYPGPGDSHVYLKFRWTDCCLGIQ